MHQALGWRRFRGPNQYSRGSACEVVQVDISKCPGVSVSDLRTTDACLRAGLRPRSLAWGCAAGRALVLIQGHIPTSAVTQPFPRMKKVEDLSSPATPYIPRFAEWWQASPPALIVAINEWKGTVPMDLDDIIEVDQSNDGRVTKFVPKKRTKA